jgi:hypothetical protein
MNSLEEIQNLQWIGLDTKRKNLQELWLVIWGRYYLSVYLTFYSIYLLHTMTISEKNIHFLNNYIVFITILFDIFVIMSDKEINKWYEMDKQKYETMKQIMETRR